MSGHRVGYAINSSLTREEHKEWAAKLWGRMDRDHSGSMESDELVCDEFQEALRSILSPNTVGAGVGNYGRAEQNCRQVIQYVMNIADKNNDGVLSFKEFEAFLRVLRNERLNPDLIFAMYDLDQDNRLERDEFMEIFRYFLGRRPTLTDFEAEWLKMDTDRKDFVTRKQFAQWMRSTSLPCFRQFLPPVVGEGSEPSVASGSSSKKRRHTTKIYRPAPGIVPQSRTKKDEFIPEWNDRWGIKDPSEQNIAWRGCQRMKTWFSRAQSEPELKRFYNTYEGFAANRRKFNTPEPPKEAWIPSSSPGARHRYKLGRDDLTKPRMIPVLSTESLDFIRSPGATRHFPYVGPDGKLQPWTEGTPRALKKRVIEPGSHLLRCPGLPPAWLAIGRANPVEASLLTFEGSSSAARLHGLQAPDVAASAAAVPAS